jgi:hypothetical protein
MFVRIRDKDGKNVTTRHFQGNFAIALKQNLRNFTCGCIGNAIY